MYVRSSRCHNLLTLRDDDQLKPEHDDQPGVFVLPIPNSTYSLRIFPGCRRDEEYCMDFVHTVTQQPVNSPFEFELWLISGPAAPWNAPGVFRIHSIEHSFRLASHMIRPGEEKFVLNDGKTYQLIRPGHKAVRFTIPRRVSPPTAVDPRLDILAFPAQLVV